MDTVASFNRTWAEFKAGFGNQTGNYWIGNDALYQLTKGGRYKMRFDLQSRNNSLWYWAEYSTFIVGNESTGYMLKIGGYSGNVTTDAASTQNGMSFTTFDRDNDAYAGANCAEVFGGGFWYNGCGICLVTGIDVASLNAGGWMYLATDSQYSLKTSKMTLIHK